MKSNSVEIGYFTTLIVWVILSFCLHGCGGGEEESPDVTKLPVTCKEVSPCAN